MDNKGFTLVEITISMLILALIISGISLFLVKISNNIADNAVKTDIFGQLYDFNYDSYLFNYNSGKILSGGLLLYSNSGGILLGSFSSQNNFNYTFNSDFSHYDKRNFGYFQVSENVLSGILNQTIHFQDTYFNKGKIYDKILIKDINILSYNSGSIYDMEIYIFKKYINEYHGELLNSLKIPKNDILKINLNF